MMKLLIIFFILSFKLIASETIDYREGEFYSEKGYVPEEIGKVYVVGENQFGPACGVRLVHANWESTYDLKTGLVKQCGSSECNIKIVTSKRKWWSFNWVVEIYPVSCQSSITNF
jgi:hypothetical protein